MLVVRRDRRGWAGAGRRVPFKSAEDPSGPLMKLLGAEESRPSAGSNGWPQITGPLATVAVPETTLRVRMDVFRHGERRSRVVSSGRRLPRV